MAVLKDLITNEEFTTTAEIAERLSAAGIDYERWNAAHDISENASDEEILAAYSAEIDRLKTDGGYVTADVINIVPTTPDLDALLDRFNKEHWHDEDEVRFIIKGTGIFVIAPENGNVVSIVMRPGDLIRVPRGTKHWFGLAGDRTVRAIRLFEDMSGWTPHYTGSGLDEQFPLNAAPAA